MTHWLLPACDAHVEGMEDIEPHDGADVRPRVGQSEPSAFQERLEANLGPILDWTPNWSPRWNIGPMATILGLRQNEDGREIDQFRWGLVPHWGKKDPKIGVRAFNARAETVATKPTFREAFKFKRLLVPVYPVVV